MKTGLPSKLAMVMLSMALAACDEAPPPNTPSEPTQTAQAWKDAPVMPIAL